MASILLQKATSMLQVHISTGQLVKQLLSSHRIEALVRGIKPQLRAEKYGKALEKLIVEVGLDLSSKAPGGYGGGGEDDGSWWNWWFPFGFFAFFCGCACFGGWNNSENRQRRAVTSHLRSLQHDCQVFFSFAVMFCSQPQSIEYA